MSIALRCVVVAAALSAVLSGAWPVAAAPAASLPLGPEVLLPHVAALPLPRGAKVIGPADPAGLITVDVVLALGDPLGAAQAVRALYDAGSPSYHHWMAPGDFLDRFGPSPSTRAMVESWLASGGLDAVRNEGTAVQASGTLARVASLLGISFERVRTAGGRVARTFHDVPRVPAGIAGEVVALTGLDSVPFALPLEPATAAYAAAAAAITTATGATTTTTTITTTTTTTSSTTQPPGTTGTLSAPCSQATQLQGPSTFLMTQVGAHYGIDRLQAGGLDGRGETIGLYEIGAHNPDDVAQYFSCFGLSNSLRTVKVDGGGFTDSTAITEADLDIEQAATQAPGASLISYEGPLTPSGIVDTAEAIVTDDLAIAVTASVAICEADAAGAGLTASIDPLLEQAAAQGQSVFVAAGDYGSEGCYLDGSTSLAAMYPASDPWATAVGGSSLSAWVPEQVWNSCSGSADLSPCLSQWAGMVAGGGGYSGVFPRPAWQRGLSLPPGPGGAACGSDCRAVPDIAADAGPQVFRTSSGWVAGGGTSAAAPLMAALVADAVSGCTERIGDWAPALYQLSEQGIGGTGITDITAGNNDATRSHGGQYPAGPGYDLASGWGTPLAPGLACPEVDSVTPAVAPAGSAVTVTGLGLERAAIYVGDVRARVISATATSATVAVPAGAGTQVVSAVDPMGTGTATSRFTYPSGTIGPSPGAGYWMIARDGSVYPFGSVPDLGPLPSTADVTAFCSDPAGEGYWATSVFGFTAGRGAAAPYPLNGKLDSFVTAMAALPAAAGAAPGTPSGGTGYWIATANGQVETAGNAPALGSPQGDGVALAAPIVGMAALPAAAGTGSATAGTGSATQAGGTGYWLVAADGGVFSFGDASFYGSMGSDPPAAPIVGIAT